MEIPASSMTDGNINGSSGNFLQTVAAADASPSTAAGTGETGEGTVETSFSEILTQQMAALLQSDETENARSSSDANDLSATSGKITDEATGTNEEVLSELAMLALLNQTLSGKIENDSTASEDMLKTLSDAGEYNVSSDAGVGGLGLSALTATDAGSSTGIETFNQNNISLSVNTETALSEVPEDVAKNGDADSEKVSDLKTKAAFNEKMPDGQKPLAADLTQKQNLSVDQKDTSSFNEIPAAESEQSTDRIAGDSQQKSIGADALSNESTDDQSSAHLKDAFTIKHSENGFSIEKEISKTGINDKTLMAGTNNRQKESAGVSRETENLKIGTASDSVNQELGKLSTNDADWQNESGSGGQPHDSTKNTSSKDFNQVLTNVEQGSVSESDKLKTEFKSKSPSAEQTTDNRVLNSMATTGNTQTNSDTNEISPSSVINRVAAEFRENLMTEGGRVKITLTPPDLGSLEMDVSVQNSKVKIMLIADNKDAQRILTGNLELLKGSLQSQGLTIERCDVMMQDQRDSSGQAFYGQQAFGQEQTGREKNSRQEPLDEKPLTSPAAVHVNIQTPVYHQQYGGSESISLFA